MENHIKSVKITNLFGERNIEWNLRKVNVLVGKNGLGKSTILRIIYLTIASRAFQDEDIFSECMIMFNDLTKNKASDLVPILQPVLQETLNKASSNSKSSKSGDNSNAGLAISAGLITALLSESIPAGLVAGGVLALLGQNSNETSSQNNLPTQPKDNIVQERFLIEREKNNINIEFISTVNMSANSVNTITKSTGEHTTLLDIEIESELKRLNNNIKQNLNGVLDAKFEDALNSFFKETGKVVRYTDEQIMISLENGNKLNFKDLSSGERQIIFIFLKVINGSVDKSLILMDEPEISLHLSWQEKLLDEITKVNDSSQIIIVTHSPAIVMNGWFDCLTDINDIFMVSNAISETA